MMTKIQLSNMAKTNPVISFFKPIASRALKKKLSGIASFLDLVTDENGNIDAENIIDEMTASLINTQPFWTDVPTLGRVTIGGGRIEMVLHPLFISVNKYFIYSFLTICFSFLPTS